MVVICRSFLWQKKNKISIQVANLCAVCFFANSEKAALQNFPVILVNFHECKEWMAINTLILQWNKYFLKLWHGVSAYSTVFLASASWIKDVFSNMDNLIFILFLIPNIPLEVAEGFNLASVWQVGNLPLQLMKRNATVELCQLWFKPSIRVL